MASIQSIIANYKRQIVAAGLLREAGAAQLSPQVAALRPSLTKINRALTENPDLLRREVNSSPFQILFEYTLPKLEVFLAGLKPERAEQIIKKLCQYGQKMIKDHGIEGAKEHLESLFKDLPDHEETLKKKVGVEKMIKLYWRADFEGKPVEYLKFVLGGQLRGLTVDASGGIHIVLGSTTEDRDLRYLKRLKNVKGLAVGFAAVSDAGLEHIKGMISLESLHLMQSPVGDRGLAHLSGLVNLRFLDLEATRVAGDGLKHLKKLVNLRELHLGSTDVPDAALEHLAGLAELQILDLDQTNVTDAGLRYLKGLINLKELKVPDAVTEAGLDELKRAIPGLKIMV